MANINRVSEVYCIGTSEGIENVQIENGKHNIDIVHNNSELCLCWFGWHPLLLKPILRITVIPVIILVQDSHVCMQKGSILVEQSLDKKKVHKRDIASSASPSPLIVDLSCIILTAEQEMQIYISAQSHLPTKSKEKKCSAAFWATNR